MKLYDGYHSVHFESLKVEKRFKALAAFGRGSTQKLYAFNNGYGASIIQGDFTFGLPELAVMKFENRLRLRSKKKRMKKKYQQRLGFSVIDYSTPVTNDIKRYDSQDEINRDLNLIARLKPDLN